MPTRDPSEWSAAGRSGARGSARLRTGTRMAILSSLIGLMFGATGAVAAGATMFSTLPFSTGEKPQSKLWYHDGSYWGVLRGPDGVAIYEKAGANWQRSAGRNKAGNLLFVPCGGYDRCCSPLLFRMMLHWQAAVVHVTRLAPGFPGMVKRLVRRGQPLGEKGPCA